MRNNNGTRRRVIFWNVLSASRTCAVLVVLALTALASIAFTMHSLSSQLETTQAAQVAATEQAAASGAYAACVGNHGAGAAAKCRAAASTFAFGDSGTEPAAFDRAVAFIYPQKR